MKHGDDFNLTTQHGNRGFCLAFLLELMYLNGGGMMDTAFYAFLFRWLHVLAGIMWIGLLYYFNFVQIPNMPNIPDEQKPAVSKVIAPAAFGGSAGRQW